MQDVMELRWNDGPKRAKASKIPDHVWVRYKEEIREKYGSMTVEELAASIKCTHGFEATYVSPPRSVVPIELTYLGFASTRPAWNSGASRSTRRR